jgi:nucleotide-binding universal stress UspA family protein
MGPIALVALIGTRGRDAARLASPSTSTSVDGPVVVACDGSEVSERLATQVVAGHRPGRQVVLLAVLPYEAEQNASEARGRAEKMTAPVEDALERAGVASRIEVRYGPPGEVIVRFADEVSASRIVIGRRGSGLTRSLLGSVSSHVAQHARAPVSLVS